MATVHPLPTIIIHLKKHVSWEEHIKEKLQDMYYKSCRFCEIHRVIIAILMLCICVGSIGISIMLKDDSIGPCYYYTSETLASDVSVNCVTYLWNIAQCSTALESSPTWKWWIQSPQGLTMVKCDTYRTGTMCGAGNYNIIRTYLPLCNPYFGQ